MLIKSLLFLFFAATLPKSIFSKANENQCLVHRECPLYTECRKLRKCPSIKANYNHFSGRMPYCNLNRRGTFVCCPVSQPPYYTKENEDRPIARACKLYRTLRECKNTGLIIGGEEVEPKEFPFMALLIKKDGTRYSYLCGGVLISSRYVLTAAHCFLKPTVPDIVRLGELDYSTTEDDASPIDFNILHHERHPNHDYHQNLNDIALVKLERDVGKFNAYIFPACLPLPEGSAFGSYTATGFGTTSTAYAMSGKDVSSHMLKVKLEHCASRICEEIIGDDQFHPFNPTSQICAGSADGKRDTCSGDSGGPIFVDHPDDNYRCLHLAVGLTSHGQGCGNAGYPAIYTRLSYYIDWIEERVWPSN